MQNGLLKVVSPVRDAPAARAGVMANDIITRLDGEATQGMTVNKAFEKMRRPVNTEVRLSIARGAGHARRADDRPRSDPSGKRRADLQVAVEDGKSEIEASGALPVRDFEKGASTTVVPRSSREFLVDGGDHTRLVFLQDGSGKATSLVLNPRLWQIAGQRLN